METKARSGFLILCLFAASCGIISETPLEHARKKAVSKGWVPVSFKSGGFELAGFIKNAKGGDDTFVVYIEGDGFAWRNRHTISGDPTPKNPIALSLAVRDSASKVLYLGRPCQYSKAGSPKCHPRYWSTHRYSPEVARAMDNVVSQVKQKVKAVSVGLVGFSGGGVVAALIAARRDDVAWLATISANLDHGAWTSWHGVTPLDGSLNPADFATELQSVPQLHFVGARDDNVPESVPESYRNRMNDPSLTEIIVMPGYDHHCCWVENWPWLLKLIPSKN